MSLFRKFFGTSGEEGDNKDKSENKSPYTPDVTLPIDELFTFNFKENGGKFIYCENLAEISENFENILAENDWFESEAQCFDARLFYLLDENKLNYNEPKNPKFFFSFCENLIADEGSILFSSLTTPTKVIIAPKFESLNSLYHLFVICSTGKLPSNSCKKPLLLFISTTTNRRK